MESTPKNTGAEASAELWELASRACNDALLPEDLARLETLLAEDQQARHFYGFYMLMHAELAWRFRGGEKRGPGVVERGLSTSVPSEAAPSTEFPAFEPLVPPFPSLSTTHYPLPTNFVGGPVFSYMVATVILGTMLLGAWAYKITHYQQIAEAPASVPSNARPELVFVGRITGMADCRWADPQTAAFAGASVPLDRKYALASGLMEISYTTGAKVILQGPCTYQVESRTGGYLALGKLTAKVEKERSEVRGQRSDHYPLSTIHYPLFSVRTPTAVVTDLGTEFGVEVEQGGNTISHVFCGAVRVQVVGESLPSPAGRGAGGEGSHTIILGENESARVEKGDGKPSITRRAAAEDSGFVLAMPPPKSVRDSEAYAELVLSLNPVVYYRMERPKGGTAGSPSSNERNGRTLLDKPTVPPTHLVFDSASGGHHGELRRGNEFGSPYVPGRFGDALLLRGPVVCDRVVVPDYPKTSNDRLTVSAWVLATGRPGWAMIASNWAQSERGPGDVGQFYLYLHRRDGDLRTKVTQRDGQWAEVREGASRPLPLFVWQHVAFVADGTTLHLYRNGEEVASCPCAGLLPQSPTPRMGIGCKLNNETGTDAQLDTPGWNFWQGRIDELAVFNQALSPQRIQALYIGKQLSDQTEATTKNTKGGHPMNGP